MDEAEWRETVAAINADVRGMVRAQRVLDEVHEELNRRAQKPIEEDFIFGDGFGQPPWEPRVITVDGIEIEIRVLHRRGLRQADIKGADLLYEIAGRKFILVQYKFPDKRHRVTRDDDQLRDLIASCPNPCPPHAPGFWPTCGAWYAIKSAAESLYHPACVAGAIFGDASSRSVEQFGRGLSAETFQELFARCWTGARVAPVEHAYFVWATLERDRVLFSVLQKGSLGRW